MPRLFFGNFDFEHSLGKTPLQQLPQKLCKINAIWTPSLIPLMNPGDWLWIPRLLLDESGTEKDALQSLVANAGVKTVSHPEQIPGDVSIDFIPWGWTKKLITWAKLQGWNVNSPPMEIVNWANSRATSFDHEQQFGSAPASCAEVKSEAELDQLTSEFSSESQWVLKAEFSMSARERMIGQGSKIPIATQNWLKKRLQHSGKVFFEPWLERIAEMSFHYEISSRSKVSFLGTTELFSDHVGRYLRNRVVVLPKENCWSESLKQTKKLAEEYANRGYFGPLSIDAMRYRASNHGSDEIIHERPLQDVNARYSMGRCELERNRRNDSATGIANSTRE